jgi:hypothetical protein
LPEPVVCRTVDDYSEVMRKEKPSNGLFSAYVPKPTTVHFDSQTQNEQVILLLRQHPVMLFKPIVLILVAIVLPIFANFGPMLNFLPDQFYFAFLLGWYLVVAGMSLQTFLVWYFNVYLVTDERIIDVDFFSIIHKNVSTAKIDNIQDVTVNTTGTFASIFDYGTILIQTAAEKNEFEFENVPHPAKVATFLNEMVIEEEHEKIEGRVS